jgi:hypothetical protein
VTVRMETPFLQATITATPDGWWAKSTGSVEQGTAAILVPGCYEQTSQGHGDKTEDDTAEQGFDHGSTGKTFSTQ